MRTLIKMIVTDFVGVMDVLGTLSITLAILSWLNVVTLAATNTLSELSLLGIGLFCEGVNMLLRLFILDKDS